MKAVVVEEVLAVAVVELEEKILVVVLEHSITDFPNRVVTESPAATLDERQPEVEALVGRRYGQSRLVDATVVENVFIVLSVDDGNPPLGVNHHLWVHIHAAAE